MEHFCDDCHSSQKCDLLTWYSCHCSICHPQMPIYICDTCKNHV